MNILHSAVVDLYWAVTRYEKDFTIRFVDAKGIEVYPSINVYGGAVPNSPMQVGATASLHATLSIMEFEKKPYLVVKPL